MVDLDRSTTAIINVHWQHEVVSPDGVFGPFFAEQVARHGIVPKAAQVNDAMRQKGGLVCYTRIAYRPGYPDLVVNTPTFAMVVEQNAYIEGTPKVQIIDELAPQPGDIVITGLRLGGFFDSELDHILRKAEIETVVFTGVATNISVMSTALEAIDYGYRIVTVSDASTTATDAAHQAALETLGLLGQVATADEVVQAL